VTTGTKIIGLLRLICLMLVLAASYAAADVRDSLDPFDTTQPGQSADDADKDKTAPELLEEAQVLLNEEHLLDARTKMLKALQKDPKEYHAHILLSGYYMVHVGHFRLALKYIKRAQELFEEKFGQAPYQNPKVQQEHAHILYLTSQVRLNLDDYAGALQVLDEFTSFGYYSDWYPGARAWILMKLGKVDDAIRVARMGMFAGSEPGRTANMLGILLSMKGERKASLDVFKNAFAYELSLGELGQPATPLNNAGEVYREDFTEDEAESSFLKATSMPDGCDHVLPSLNLALLYMEQLNFGGAKRAMDNFESCVAQFPLRNGEEHVPLVHLARGRIDYHTGHVDSAINHLRAALEGRQWFGKIGTSQEDMQAASLISLGQFLSAKNNQEGFIRYSSWLDWAASLKRMAENATEAWWLKRRARQVLAGELNNLEDIQIRNTDSLIEYQTFGELLAGLPTETLEKRIAWERKTDLRLQAVPYYQAYLAENYFEHGQRSKALSTLNELLGSVRPRYDDGLKLHALALELKMLSPGGNAFNQIATQVFQLSRAELRNNGLPLPVNFTGDIPAAIDELNLAGFRLDNSIPLPFSIEISQSGNSYLMEFKSEQGTVGAIKVKSESLPEAVNRLADEVFVVTL
jgi:Tfp pilus assembly protein PilF